MGGRRTRVRVATTANPDFNPRVHQGEAAQRKLEHRSSVPQALRHSGQKDSRESSTWVSSSDRCACFRLRERRADSLLESILHEKGKARKDKGAANSNDDNEDERSGGTCAPGTYTKLYMAFSCLYQKASHGW